VAYISGHQIWKQTVAYKLNLKYVWITECVGNFYPNRSVTFSRTLASYRYTYGHRDFELQLNGLLQPVKEKEETLET
jgi:hypothetical protein